METRQVRYFLAVAQSGSFTAAASRIGIAQPALSTQVSKLESELGCTLFLRRPRGVELTAAGERFRVHAVDICERMEAAQREARSTARQFNAELTLGMPTLMSTLLIAPLLEAVRSALPDVTLRVREAMGVALREMLAGGQLDVAILYQIPSDMFSDSLVLFEEDLFLGTASRVGVRFAAELSGKELTSVPLVLSTAGNSHREQMEDFARRAAIRLNIVAEVDSISGQREVVLNGAASAILPRSGFCGWPEGSVNLARIAERTLVSRAIMVLSDAAKNGKQTLLLRDVTGGLIRGLIANGKWPGARSPPRARLAAGSGNAR